MFSKFIPSKSSADFKSAFEEVTLSANTILILACDDNQYRKQDIDPILQQCDKKVLGGIFPQIIYQNQKYSQGAILLGLDEDLDVSLIENISNKSDFSQIIEDKIGELSEETSTMFVFVDGLSQNIAPIIDRLFDNYGLAINYIGGGAGSLSFEQNPVIFSNQGLLEDCAIFAKSTLRSGIGVKHGWKSISDTYKVTRADKNTIYELDYQDAFDVYKKVVEKASQKRFTDSNFFDISKSYPFGINKLSGEMVVRDPIVLQDKALICVGEGPENTFVNILEGEKSSLISAAKEAYDESIDSLESDVKTFTLFIDCISRVLFLEDAFDDEIQAVYDKESTLVGALTLGEIANNKRHYLEFYNKTAVIAKIENG
jgi:hypothetical protein